MWDGQMKDGAMKDGARKDGAMKDPMSNDAGSELRLDEARLDEARRAEAALDARVAAVLESVPEVGIAGDFAARVAGLAPARRLGAFGSLRTTRFGYWAMVGSVVVLVVAMVLVAASRGQGTVWVEWMLCGEFVGLVMWLGVRRWNLIG